MKRGRFVSFVAAAMIVFLLCGQIEAATAGILGIGDFFEDAAAGISEAAGKAGEVISGAAGQAGEVISGAAGQAGEVISGAAGQAGEVIGGAASQAGEAISGVAGQAGEAIGGAASQAGAAIGGAASQAGDIALGFAANAGDVMKQWGENVSETSDAVKKTLEDAGLAITVEAAELSSSTMKKASDITNMAGDTVDGAIAAVSNAGDFVLDQAGHVVDMASIGIGNASREASQALDALQECGTQLVEIAGDAVDGLDLDNEAVWNQAELAIHKAVKNACEKNILPIRLDEETITILSDILLVAVKGGYQCSRGRITLGDYTHGMSDVIIRNGIPAGVGTIAGLLTGGNGTAMKLAREATFLIITSANSDPTDVRPLWEVDQD